MEDICQKCFGAKPNFCICTDHVDIPKLMPKWAIQGCLLCNPPVYFRTITESKKHFEEQHRAYTVK